MRAAGILEPFGLRVYYALRFCTRRLFVHEPRGLRVYYELRFCTRLRFFLFLHLLVDSFAYALIFAAQRVCET